MCPGGGGSGVSGLDVMTHIVFQKQDTHDTSYVLHLQVALQALAFFPGLQHCIRVGAGQDFVLK